MYILIVSLTIKKKIKKFNNILENQLKEKDTLTLRITTFPNILDLLKGYNSTLYSFKPKTPNSLYDGDFGLMKMYEQDICCLLGLKKEENNNNYIICSPNSYMASNRINRLVEFRNPIYFKSINAVQNKMFEIIEK